VPDMVVSTPEQRRKRGVVGSAELVVEILSPHDETYEKLPFYESLGVKEVLVIDPETRKVELFVLRTKRLRKAKPDREGRVRSKVLDVRFSTKRGPKLRVEANAQTSDI
jgi:Uma2 family endonuclease